MYSRSLSSHAQLATAICILLTGCKREARELRPEPSRAALFADAVKESDLEPGGRQPRPGMDNPYHGNAYAISEGRRLFAWYNCSGCHANGGGGIGPPLIKDAWIYGGEPGSLFESIVKGRPNGMPAWAGRIPEVQVWQLVTYVRSLNNQEPKSATPPRGDTIELDPHTLLTKPGGAQK